MQDSVFNVNLDEKDEVTAMLARMLYVHFQTHRNKDSSPAPFVPAWAYDYAKIAVRYCGYDGDSIDSLRKDYV